MSIKRLILEFPCGTTPEACQTVADLAQKFVGSSVSEGGYTMTYMPMTQEEEKHRGCEFKEDEMTYVYGYKKGKESKWNRNLMPT